MSFVIQKKDNTVNLLDSKKPSSKNIIYTFPIDCVCSENQLADSIVFLIDGNPIKEVPFYGIKYQDFGGNVESWTGNIADFINKINSEYFIKNGVDYFSNIALGNVSGAVNWRKSGENATVTTAQKPVNGGGTAIVPLDAAAQISFVSSSGNDTLLGSGARVIRIFGVDASGLMQQEDLELSGTTPVLTANSYLGILNRVFVVSVGDGATKSNQGIITGTSGGNTYCTIIIGDSAMKQLAFYVPAGKTALVYSYFFDSSKNAGSVAILDIVFYVIQGGVKYNLFSFKIDQATGNDVSVQRNFKTPLPMTENSIWWAECKSSIGTETLTAEVEQVLFDN